uniref:Putative aminoacid transporter n=1 Tax=Encephalitozoon cuniculi TaxID=6035 RepID=M1KJW2_ENCCN|nr:putative aminoacid transporter [Encephalitozoon cuniculi]
MSCLLLRLMFTSKSLSFFKENVKVVDRIFCYSSNDNIDDGRKHILHACCIQICWICLRMGRHLSHLLTHVVLSVLYLLLCNEDARGPNIFITWCLHISQVQACPRCICYCK